MFQLVRTCVFYLSRIAYSTACSVYIIDNGYQVWNCYLKLISMIIIRSIVWS